MENGKISAAAEAAAEALAKTYESMTLKKIEKAWRGSFGYGAAKKLTGFGNIGKCRLCVASTEKDNRDHDCTNCIHITGAVSDNIPCIGARGAETDYTYYDISGAETPEELLKAYKKRAEYIRKLLILYREGETTCA